MRAVFKIAAQNWIQMAKMPKVREMLSYSGHVLLSGIVSYILKLNKLRSERGQDFLPR